MCINCGCESCTQERVIVKEGQQGPPGPKGDPGVKGDPGEKGDKGDPGTNGSTFALSTPAKGFSFPFTITGSPAGPPDGNGHQTYVKLKEDGLDPGEPVSITVEPGSYIFMASLRVFSDVTNPGFLNMSFSLRDATGELPSDNQCTIVDTEIEPGRYTTVTIISDICTFASETEIFLAYASTWATYTGYTGSFSKGVISVIEVNNGQT